MNLNEVMKRLDELRVTRSKDQNSSDNEIYVPFSYLYKLQEQLGINHDLALQLWSTQDNDARSLALLLADPFEITFDQAELWLNDLSSLNSINSFALLIAKSSFSLDAILKWINSSKPSIQRVGYDVVTLIFRMNRELIDEACSKVLEVISTRDYADDLGVKEASRSALITIGVHKPLLTEQALSIAKTLDENNKDVGGLLVSDYILKAVKK